MLQTILTFITALSISIVAAWFSITGLSSLFAGASVSVIIMASALEVGKLVSISWLYWNWKVANLLIKSFLVSFVIVLMLITSMGIFGYLSKAHIEQSSPTLNNESQVQLLQSNIDREQRVISDAEQVLFQLDEAVNTLIKYDRIRGPDGSLAVRQSQKEERSQLTEIINEAQSNIDEYTTEQYAIQSDIRKYEVELGPIKYISALFYESSTPDTIETSIRYMILLLVFVFDPLAVTLLIAANNSLKEATRSSLPPSPDPIIDPPAPVERNTDQKPKLQNTTMADDVEKKVYFDSTPSSDELNYPKKS